MPTGWPSHQDVGPVKRRHWYANQGRHHASPACGLESLSLFAGPSIHPCLGGAFGRIASRVANELRRAGFTAQRINLFPNRRLRHLGAKWIAPRVSAWRNAMPPVDLAEGW